MHVEVVTPAPPGSHHGNRVTAERWVTLLRGLGHSVALTTSWSMQPAEVLVALHARRSAQAVMDFRSAHPDRPVVLALTGTDLYADLADSEQAQRTAQHATALVVLQDKALEALPASWHERVHVIYQSVVTPVRRVPPGEHLEVLLLAHLREVKDPFLVLAALGLLPGSSRIRVTHLGSPIDPGSGERAVAAAADDSRYCWLGDVPRPAALQRLADSDLLVLTSRLEGGANAVSEALAAGVPVVSTRVDGSVGLLGESYPGYVEVGDAAGLARLLERAANDEGFLAELTRHVAARRHLVAPERERQAWVDLLAAVLR
ncbi:MAG: TIGR04348 family glycosyltransferase [Actinomycetota bacterium]|nr:TIGR04348 family glycosyltransferase [Actinomycetota bacterium]